MFRGCTNAIEHVTNCHHFDYAYNVMQDGTYFLKGKHAATGTAFIRGGWYDVANLNSVCDDTQANMKTNYNVIVFDDNNILP